MTTQHSPHTRLGRWAIGLTDGSVLLFIFGGFFGIFFGVDVFSPWVWVILIAGLLAGAVVGLLALLRSPQHAPHTSPLWRRVLSLPQTRLGWWAVALVGIALIAFVIASTIPDPEDVVSLPWWEVALKPIAVITVLVAPLAGGVVGSLALGAGERSLLVWFAEVPPALLFVGFFSIFRENPQWVKQISAGVLVWAVIAFSIYWPRLIFLRSQGRSS